MRRSPNTTWWTSGGGSTAGSATCTCRTTPARAGTPTFPPGEGVLPLGAFLDDLAASDYEGAISLEVDLRRYLTDAERLSAIMVSMREGVERRLADPAVRREAG